MVCTQQIMFFLLESIPVHIVKIRICCKNLARTKTEINIFRKKINIFLQKVQSLCQLLQTQIGNMYEI